MALTNEEKQIAEFGKKQGKSSFEVMDAVSRYRSQQTPEPGIISEGLGVAGDVIKDIPSDIGETATGVVDAVGTGFKTAFDASKQVGEGEITRGAGAVKAGGAVAQGFARGFGEGVLGLLKIPVTQKAEEQFGRGAQRIGGAVAEKVSTEFTAKLEELKTSDKENERIMASQLEGLADKYANDPSFKAYADGLGGFAEAGAELIGLKGSGTVLKSAAGGVKSLFTKAPVDIDDVIKQADIAIPQKAGVNIPVTDAGAKPSFVQRITQTVNMPETKIDLDSVNTRLDKLIEQGDVAGARKLAEETAPKLTTAEKWAGIRPDIKARIAGKQEKLAQYFDAAHTRNSSDLAPSVYEYGGTFAQDAVTKMDAKLAETGGRIGQIRDKLGTVQAQRPDIDLVNRTFDDTLSKLNLEVKNGSVIQKPGTPSRLQGTGDLAAINELAAQVKLLNQSPSLGNIIDIRTTFDGKINFGKSQREISNSVDSLAGRMRTALSNAEKNIVGKTGAADLAEYSNFMTAYNDLKGFTDKKAGSEYLLRVMLSGRGGDARAISQTIKAHTGIDLMDDATMMQIATELIGNESQKNLFRQELSKASLDAARLAGGDPSGAAVTLFQKGVDRILNHEKIFLKAAE